MPIVSTHVASMMAASAAGAGTGYVVRTAGGVLYVIYQDHALDATTYKKSTDNGITWGSPVTVMSGATSAIAVWYDRWSNISGGLIHVARTETGTDDTDYRTIDTENSDTLSTETEIFAGSSTANGGHLSITRARGGNVYCKTVIDAGAEGGFFRLLNANVPNGAWASRTVDEAIATTDQMILLPGWAADNQDIMAFFWDASADEISRKLHDDSANSWGESSIATTMVDAVSTTAFPHFAAAVDITNSRNLLVAWSAVDTAGADLRCWHVTESAITEVTNVVTDSTDDQGCCAIGIDTNTQDWYVFYAGKTDGSETFNTTAIIYYKVSTDDGATWGSETELSPGRANVGWLITTPRFPSIWTTVQARQTFEVISHTSAPPALRPRASFQLGM